MRGGRRPALRSRRAPASVPLPGGSDASRDAGGGGASRATGTALAPAVIGHLAGRYGSRLDEVLGLVGARPRARRGRSSPALPDPRAEVVAAVEQRVGADARGRAPPAHPGRAARRAPAGRGVADEVAGADGARGSAGRRGRRARRARYAGATSERRRWRVRRVSARRVGAERRAREHARPARPGPGPSPAALARAYPDAWCALDHGTPWELRRRDHPVGAVHRRDGEPVTPALFAELPDAGGARRAPTRRRVEALIKPDRLLPAEDEGHPGDGAGGRRASTAAGCPDDMEALTALPGHRAQDRQRGARHGVRPAGDLRRHPRATPRRTGSASRSRTTRTRSSATCRRSCRPEEWTALRPPPDPPRAARLRRRGKPRCSACPLRPLVPADRRHGVRLSRRAASSNANLTD